MPHFCLSESIVAYKGTPVIYRHNCPISQPPYLHTHAMLRWITDVMLVSLTAVIIAGAFVASPVLVARIFFGDYFLTTTTTTTVPGPDL